LDSTTQTLFLVPVKKKKIDMGFVNHWGLFRKFYFVALTMFLIVAVGVTGYMTIENWTFLDSLYMTVITITTVGFGEIHPLSFEGRLFTTILVLSTFGTFAYLLSSVTTMIASGELAKTLKIFRQIKKMNTIENHVIICGLGRVGNQVKNDLLNQGYCVVAIEKRSTENQYDTTKYLRISGDATSDTVLEDAGILKAKTLIACLPNDADNMYVVLSARAKNPSIQIVARATYQNAVDKLKMAGAHHVIMPDSIGGTHMAALVSSPEVINFLDKIRTEGQDGTNIESITFDELPLEYQGKSLEELNIKKRTGATIIGFKPKDGDYIINPAEDVVVREKCVLLVLGNTQQIKNVNQLFNLPQK
jgi:voltage-gated potassium channel